jgi:peptide/nickel transport system substrate-binding protein
VRTSIRSTSTTEGLRTRFVRRAWPIPVVVLSVLAAACSSSSPAASNGSTAAVVTGSGGTVTVRSVDDVDTFNPATTTAPNMSVQAIELSYDRLVYLSPTGKLEPFLATSWTTTPNSASLKIRKGATCADGTPVTPTVVANSLRYELDPATNGPYANYVTGQGGLESVTADDTQNSVTITLKAPYNALMTALATPYAASIICPQGVSNPTSLDAAPDGSGPYVLDKARSVRGSVYVFTLRKDYKWGPAGWSANKDGIPNTIVDRVVTDESTAANLLTTGQVDVAPVFGINEPRVAANHAAYTFTTSALQMGSWGVVMNQSPGRVGADPAVRHAIYLALDGPSMVKAAFSTEGVAFSTLTTPNMQCYDPSVGKSTPGFNPSQAKAILERDGFHLGGDGVMSKNGQPLTVAITMWNTTGPLGDYIQQSLQKIGIKPTVQSTDISTWLNALYTTKSYDLTVYAYYSGLPNPSIFPSAESSLNIIDPKYFALAAKAEAAPPATACQAWSTALSQSELDFNVKPIGVSKNIWFGNSWKFAAPYDVIFDPFTMEKTR